MYFERHRNNAKMTQSYNNIENQILWTFSLFYPQLLILQIFLGLYQHIKIKLLMIHHQILQQENGPKNMEKNLKILFK